MTTLHRLGRRPPAGAGWAAESTSKRSPSRWAAQEHTVAGVVRGMTRLAALTVVCVFLVTALTGCLNNPRAGDVSPSMSGHPTSMTESVTSTQTTSAGERPPALPPERMLFSNCTGFTAGGNARLRPNGPPVPPGWEPRDPTVLGYSVLLHGYECQRISAGPFERGPIHIIWDGHSDADFPADCLLNETGSPIETVLNVFMIDDPELAAYFQQTYDLPAIYSAVQFDAPNSAAPRLLTWRWQTGRQTSEFHLVDDGTSSPDPTGDRMFWQRGDGIGQMDFLQEQFSPEYGNRFGYGTAYAPMLQSDNPQGQFAGTADNIQSDGPTVVSLYSDLLCKQPESMG